MQAICPKCNQTEVTVPMWDFADTSVTVPYCDTCRADTFVVGVTVKVSAVGQFAVPQYVTRHKEGLVTFV